MLERQREGIAKAKAEGLYKDRKPITWPILEDFTHQRAGAAQLILQFSLMLAVAGWLRAPIGR